MMPTTSPRLHLEIDVLERPELLDTVARHDGAASHHVGERTTEACRSLHDGIAQRAAAAVARMADEVFLAEAFGADHDIGRHQIKSAKVFSVRRKYPIPSQSKAATTATLSERPGQ